MTNSSSDAELRDLKEKLDNLKREMGKEEEIEEEKEREIKKKEKEEKIRKVERQEKSAREIVDASSIAAGGVGIIPIPFADAIPI